MDQKIKEWWDKGAGAFVKKCIDHSHERILNLKIFANQIDNLLETDVELNKSFSKDIRKIIKHNGRIKDPILKNREEFFIINLKNYLFNIAFMAGTFTSLKQEVAQTVDEYACVEGRLSEVKQRYHDEIINIKNIEDACRDINVIQYLDDVCKDLVLRRSKLEEERDDVLSEMQAYVNREIGKREKEEAGEDMKELPFSIMY